MDAVDDRAFVRAENALDAGQALVDALPAGSDQVDQERQIVDACVPLGEQIAVEPLEPADEVRGQAAHLREVLRDRQHLLAQTVLERLADAFGQGCLERRGGLGQRLDLMASPLERCGHVRRLRSALGYLAQPLVRPLDRAWIHRSQR